MTKRIVDIHGHNVFGVDDGAQSIDMSLDMIKTAYDQVVREIFCTSHDGYNVDEYKRNLNVVSRSII